jgi:O-antigen/teichoic acid export membrane protein
MEKMKSLEQNEIKNTIGSAGLSGFGILFAFGVRFITSIVVTRFLGPQLYGIFVLGSTVSVVGKIFAISGLERGVQRFVSFYRGQERPEQVSRTIVPGTLITAVISPFITACLYFLATPIAIRIFRNPDMVIVIQILAFSIPFGAIGAVWLHAIQGYKKIGHQVLVEDFLAPLIQLGLMVSVLLLGGKLKGISLASVLAAVVTSIFALLFLKKHFSIWEKTKFFYNWELVSFSIPLFFVNILNFLLNRADVLMLGYFKAASEVGIYFIAFRIALLVQFPLNSFGPIFGPTMSEFFGQSEIMKAGEFYKITTKWVLSLSIPIFVIVFLYSSQILSMFGRHFVAGSSAVAILGLAQFINCGVGHAGLLIVMSGHPKVNLINSLILLCCNIVLNYLLIPPYGLLGTAIATGASVIAINIIRLIEVYSLLRMHPYTIRFVKPLFAGAVSFLFTLVIKDLLGEAHQVILVLEVLGSISLYGALLWVLKIDDEDNLVLDLILKRFRRNPLLDGKGK